MWQANVGQLVLGNSNWCVWMTQQHLGKKLARIETTSMFPQQFANMLLHHSQTPIWVCQCELANIILTCEGCFRQEMLFHNVSLYPAVINGYQWKQCLEVTLCWTSNISRGGSSDTPKLLHVTEARVVTCGLCQLYLFTLPGLKLVSPFWLEKGLAGL